MMVTEDVGLLAKYPFLRRTKDYVNSYNMPFDELLKHPIYSAALEMGRQRVIDCMESKYKADASDELRNKLTILSYPLARMMAHTLGRVAAAKYADGEAQAAYELLKDEDEEVKRLVAEDLGLKAEDGKMPLIQYTRLSAALARSHPKWKLTNRQVDRGFVEVDIEDATVLSREAIKNRVLEPIDLKKIPDEVKKTASGMKTMLQGDKATMDISALEQQAMPPCMNGMAAALETGLASHNAMFILATFLANLGLKKEDILKVYSKSPKYDEEKTLYQLEFLLGEKGGTEYTCPTCATIKSHGLCKAECEVKHPLQYYRRHAKNRPKVIKREKK
jgi:DNA primase large subunit